MSNIFSNIIIAIFLIIIQGLFLNNVNFLEWLNPYIYLYFIIYFPLKSNRTLYITISFLYGLIIDFFSDMHAIHSAACLIIAYSRPYFLKLYFGMAYEHQVVKFNSLEIKQNIFYLFNIIIIHHLTLFCLEIFDVTKISLILSNTLSNSIFTFFSIYVLYEFLLNNNKRS